MRNEEQISFMKKKIQELQKQLANLINLQTQELFSQKSSQPRFPLKPIKKSKKLLLIGTSRTKSLKPRSIANNFYIHYYRGASLSDLSSLGDAHRKTTMQILVVVVAFNDHRNSFEDISIACRALIAKLREKFAPQRLKKPKTIQCLDSQISPKTQSMNDILNDLLKGENLTSPNLNETFFPVESRNKVYFSIDAVRLFFG